MQPDKLLTSVTHSDWLIAARPPCVYVYFFSWLYRQAKKGFGSRTFDGKSVDATYFPEDKFASKMFST